MRSLHQRHDALAATGNLSAGSKGGRSASLPFLVMVLLLLGAGCAEPPPVPPVGTIIAPASSPKRYAAYPEIDPLFRQDNDTTYVINFWATWCRPCLEELPVLQQLQEESEGRPLRVVLVSLDTEDGAIDRIPGFLAKQGIELPTVVLTDESASWKRELDEKWDGSLPTTVIYRGGLRYVYRRPFMGREDLAAAVAPLLRQ